MSELEKLLAAGHLPRAQQVAEQILAREPEGPQAREAQIALAKISLVKGDLPNAEKLATKAEAKGRTPETMLLRASLHGQRGELDKAEQQYRDALARNPKLAEAHFGLGLMLAKTERMADAVVSLEQAVALSPQNATFLFRLAQALLETDRFEDAIPRFEAALAVMPKFIPAWLALTQAVARRGDLLAARRILDRGLKAVPDHPRLLAALTNVSLLQGDVKTSQKVATHVANVRPDDPDAQGNLALLLMLQGKRKDAQFIAQRMASLGKVTAPLKMVEATYWEGEEPPNYKKAIAAYEEAMAADVDGWRAPNNFGQLLLRMPSDPPDAQVARAVTVLEEAHRRKPDQLEPMLNLALAYVRAGEKDKALELGQRLLGYRLPDDHPIRDQATRLVAALSQPPQ